MAYPRARGKNPFNYDEYDPTPFSGGYDQVALYGRPKSPSAETCYPISEVSHHESGSYGAGTTPYSVDEYRPAFQQEDTPHGSDDFSYGYEGTGSGSGYGIPEPSSYEEGGGGYGSGYSRPKPSGYDAEGGCYEPSFEEGGQWFGSGYAEGEEAYGRPQSESTYSGIFGGFGWLHREEGYGDFDERPPQEDGSFGYGRREPSRFEGKEEGFWGLFGEGDEGLFGGGRRSGGFQSDEFWGEEGYGGRKHSDYDGETGDYPSYFNDDNPPPAGEGFGGFQGEEHHHGHHWLHNED